MRMGNERNEDVGLHIVQDSAAGLESREILSQVAFKIWPTVHYFYEGMTRNFKTMIQSSISMNNLSCLALEGRENDLKGKDLGH